MDNFAAHEKRKFRRLPIKLDLEVSSLFKQDNELIGNLDAELEVFDISKAGIGFTTTSELPTGYYFNATIEFNSPDEKILTVVKILYSALADEETNLKRYGCEFVGLAPILYSFFDNYEEKLKSEHVIDE
ncbi:MAG: PilZ domain-containing protein [Lachnospiraceae bacterium]|nr:PilZ domain-containing protein [Lachnospiraceae bacterium]